MKQKAKTEYVAAEDLRIGDTIVDSTGNLKVVSNPVEVSGDRQGFKVYYAQFQVSQDNVIRTVKYPLESFVRRLKK